MSLSRNTPPAATDEIVNIIYPVGSKYSSTDSTSPAEKFGGEWTLIYSDKIRYEVGSQVLYEGVISGTNTNGEYIKICGAYDDTFIDGMFLFTTCPSGFHREYRLTYQGTTGENGKIQMAINNIETSSICTWSGSQFRYIDATQYFKYGELSLEPVVGYEANGRTGINLKYRSYLNNFNIYNPTIHGYYASDNIYYEWVRIS